MPTLNFRVLNSAETASLVVLLNLPKWQEMASWPQWAYLPHRGVDQALAIAFRHCSEVKEILKGQQLTLRHKHQGIQRDKLGGGLLSIDMQGAFDRLTHQAMELALQRTQTPEHMQIIIRAWHQNMTCHVGFARECRKVKAERGIRQGCKAGPIRMAS